MSRTRSKYCNSRSRSLSSFCSVPPWSVTLFYINRSCLVSWRAWWSGAPTLPYSSISELSRLENDEDAYRCGPATTMPSSTKLWKLAPCCRKIQLTAPSLLHVKSEPGRAISPSSFRISCWEVEQARWLRRLAEAIEVLKMEWGKKEAGNTFRRVVLRLDLLYCLKQ